MPEDKGLIVIRMFPNSNTVSDPGGYPRGLAKH